MKRFAFLLGLITLLVAPLASAGEFNANTQISRVWGDQLAVTTSTTNDTTGDWGFWSDYVKVCVEQTSGTVQVPVFMRFGIAVSDSPPAHGATNDIANMTLIATSDTIFRNGTSATGINAVLIGRAMRVSAEASPGDVNASSCFTEPWVTRGVVIGHGDGTAANATATATVDVWAYQTMKPR